jgi:HNH endonuclease
MQYSNEQLLFLRESYKTMSRAELADAFNKKFNVNQSLSSIIACLKNHKIQSGRSGHFIKGNVSWNNGTKGLIKANSGTFKKGNQPANQKPLGHERICTKDGYALIKVAEANPYTGAKTRYRHKHQVVWEENHGPIPKGFIVTFRDGNKTNFDIGNLELIDRNHLCRYNFQRVNSLPSELIPTMKKVVNLKVKIMEKEKEIS